MDRANKARNRKNNKARKPPKVPIKTYRWEDIRRARRRGGYPWTYLYKHPFNEEVDSEQFTMDALRRSKSASTMGARSDGVDISDVSSYFSGKTTPNFLQTEIITEPHDDSAKHSRAGSEVIEEFIEEDDKDLEDDVQVKEFQTGSIASSDNISQYLDKEERGPGNSNTNDEDDIDKKDDTSTSRDKRAQSEETSPRKRRLSAESSHSKYSLSRLSVIKKFKDARSKIKVPKMTFPTKKILRRKGSPPKDVKKEEKVKKDTSKSTEPRKPKKNVQPVYIHIPLKPPPGETDQFSHLEFEPKQTTDKSAVQSEEKSTEVESGQMNGKSEEPKVTAEEKINIDSAKSDAETKEEDKKDFKGASPFSTLEQGPRVVKKPPLKINPAFKQFLKDVRQLKDQELMEVQKEKGTEINKEGSEKTTDEVDSETPSSPKKRNLEIQNSDEEHLDLEEQQTSDSESPKVDVFDKLFEASASKKEDATPQTPQKQPAEDPSSSRNVRSKSAEPQRKRKSSIDSSYSRKSLSKLGIMKKLKEASNKIKGAFSLSSLKRSDSKKEEIKEKVVKKKPPTQMVKPKQVEPVYIHIPLKPPPGQKDEFSDLVKEPAGKTEQTKEERSDSLDSTSPDSTKNGDIQFIFLTPPSDDEILDKDPDIPETPSSEDSTVFFGIGTLKKLAETVVDEVSPETRRKALETVREESASDRGSAVDIEAVENKVDAKEPSSIDQKEDRKPEIVGMVPKEVEIKTEKAEEPIPQKLEDDKTAMSATETPKMVVDVEDGLNETPKTEELKSVLKTTENTSPVLKKKVSFKRKTRPTKIKIEADSGYETIEAPKEEKTINLLEQAGIFDTKPCVDMKIEDNKDKNLALQDSVSSPKDADRKGFLADISQSMSVEDEKGYLDQKIVKDTSLEEDYNKWSRSGDHEYEPINPPEEVTLMTSSVIPGVTLIDSDNEPKVVISATDILDKPLEEKKKPFFQFGRFGKEKNQGEAERSPGGSSDDHSRSSQGREVPDMGEQQKANEGPNKFQVAFKHRTDQLRNKTNQLRDKVRNIKKPTIHMPKAPEFKKPNFKKPDFKKPDFKRFKFETPKINLHLPKIPDTATIHLPHISLPGAKKTTVTKTVETRQYSTESTAGDSESPKPRSKFDFNFSGTFPRFKKKKTTEEQNIAYGTTPRAKKPKDADRKTTESSSSSIRIPLHSEDSMDAEERLNFNTGNEPIRTSFEDRETSVDIDRSSHMRFNKDIDIEDDYERENQEINRAEYLNRWQHGNLRQHEREMGDGEANDEELIVGQLVAERFNRVGPQYDNEKDREPPYETYDDDQSETLEDRLRRDEARPHYSEDEEDFDQRNKEMITDLDNLEEEESGTQIRDGYSSEGSVSLQRQGRLGKLDVDSDEFFVVHEIREGFQTPANALAQMNEYDPIGSNRSLPQVPTKRKPIKKPKRKKTPHVSQEEIPGDEESIDRAVSPSRPKRKSKKSKKKSDEDEFIPYQRTIHLEQEDLPRGQRLDFPRESLGILGDDEGDDQEFEMYENERMQGREQPEILVSDPYKEFQVMEQKMRAREEAPSEEPAAPPRRHRSLKSLSQSETGSIPIDKYETRNTEPINIEDYIIPAHEIQTPPRRPSRRSRSQTSSLSRVSLPPSNRDTDSLLADEVFLTENQPIPSYLIENQHYKQQYKGNQEVPAYLQEDQPLKPCAEEPCIQDLRDYMGYSIVDKSRQREPPLPPPKTTRRKKRQIEPEQKFATVPRDLGSTQPSTSQPVRPLRNYSTLGQVKSSRKDSSHYENDDKENREVDIAQYIEIDEELNKDLISGDVVQKMRQRPLPAPPRPPRKTKTTRKSLQDITSRENIIPSSTSPSELKQTQIEEETVSTQTDPLPPDFVCEEIHQEPTDTIITPRVTEKPSQKVASKETSEQQTHKPEQTQPKIRRELITPTVYSYEETVTHGSLLVEPLNGAKVVPDHQLSRERLVPVAKEDSDEETSEIPESFKKLKSPEETKETHGKHPEVSNSSIEVLRTDKLQVSDLDVDRLRVNELLASKIVVSEIDSASISTNEIQGKSGPLRVGDIELPSRFIEEIVRKLEKIRPGEQRLQEEPDHEEKKTSISEVLSQESTQHPANVESPLEPSLPLSVDTNDHLESISGLEYSEHQQQASEDVLQHELSPEPPVPPPRSYTLEDAPPDAPPRTLRRKSKDSSRPSDNQKTDTSEPEKTDQPLQTPEHRRFEMLEPEIDDQPPPRPPEPLEGLYMPSQPPASFYALRAKQYVGLENENIPTVPRRKRRQSKPMSRSRSTSDDSSLSPSHHQTRSLRSTRRFSDSSIPELSGRLIRACGTRINNSLKRLIYHLTENILRNADGKQDLHVFMIILLVLIAGLILLGYGEERTVVHLHHWEYFNPPKDL